MPKMRDVLGKMRECGKYIKMRDFPHNCGMVDKGKVRPFRRLESSSDAQNALIAITSGKVDASSERVLLHFGTTLFGAKAAESSSLN